MRLISIGNFASGVIGAFLSLPSHFKILFLLTVFSSLFKTLHLLSFLNACWLFLIKTPFPLQYFVAPPHKNHGDSIECFHYDDVFRHMFGTDIMSRRFTFESDIWDVLRRLHIIVEHFSSWFLDFMISWFLWRYEFL